MTTEQKVGRLADAIPRDEAFQLCAEIRQEARARRWTVSALQCWGCTAFSEGDPEKMCVSSNAGYRGCYLVNARYDQLKRIGA